MDDIYVLKFGGNAVRGKDDLDRLSSGISEMLADGAKVILVHGGGPEISEEMERRGLHPEKVCGVRVTDADTLEVTEAVLRRINADVVASLQAAGVMAIGIPGYFCTLCARKPVQKVVEDGVEREVDFGLVGDVVDVDPSSVFDLLEQGITPVVYPIGKDAEGRMLNVNADTMVAGIAAGVGCREMIAITDVPGILRDVGDPGSKIDSLSLEEVDRLIGDGTISGGMIPKVEACRRALLAGAGSVRMINGKDPGCKVSDAVRGAPLGTVITR